MKLGTHAVRFLSIRDVFVSLSWSRIGFNIATQQQEVFEVSSVQGSDWHVPICSVHWDALSIEVLLVRVICDPGSFCSVQARPVYSLTHLFVWLEFSVNVAGWPVKQNKVSYLCMGFNV